MLDQETSCNDISKTNAILNNLTHDLFRNILLYSSIKVNENLDIVKCVMKYRKI